MQRMLQSESVGVKLSRCWGLPGCRYRWQAAPLRSQPGLLCRRKTPPKWVRTSHSAKRKSATLAWRPSTSSITKMTEYRDPYNLSDTAAAVEATGTAAAVEATVTAAAVEATDTAAAGEATVTVVEAVEVTATAAAAAAAAAAASE
jgi:hypothetical protein